jgi:hypothetical protein
MTMTLEEMRHKHARLCIVEQAGSPEMAMLASIEADRIGKRIAKEEAFLRMQGFLDDAKAATEYEESKRAYIQFEEARLDWLRISYDLIDSGLQAIQETK